MKFFFEKYLVRGSFARNVLTLMTGTTIAQAIPIAIAPILSRIYTPADFGDFALYSSLIAILGVAATGGYERTIMLPEDDGDAVNLVALSISISVGLGLVTFALVYILNSQITVWLNNPSISPWLYFVPLSVALTGIYQSLNYWNTRRKQFSNLALSRVARASAVSSTQLTAGYSGMGVGGLVGGNLLGQFAANLVLGWQLRSKRIQASRLIESSAMRRLMRRYQKFSRLGMPSSVLNAVSAEIPVLLLTVFFSPITAGFYFFGQRLLSIPMSLIGSSVSQVFFEKIRHHRTDVAQLAQLSLDSYRHLLFLGSFPLAVVLIYGPAIFAFVFGEPWRVAGEYSQNLSVWMLFVFAGSPITPIIAVLERQKEGLYFNILILISRVFVIWGIAAYFESAKLAVFVFGVVGALLWFLYIGYILNIAGNTVSRFLAVTIRALIPAAILHSIIYIIISRAL